MFPEMFTYCQGTVDTIFMEPGPYLELEVSDTGYGIPENQLERIFEILSPKRQNIMFSATMTPEVKAIITARKPIGRMGKPEEIASMVVYLATEDADFMVLGTRMCQGNIGNVS